jgi:hypothetical protein
LNLPSGELLSRAFCLSGKLSRESRAFFSIALDSSGVVEVKKPKGLGFILSVAE